MKTYKEIAQNVFEKRDEYLKKKQERNRIIKKCAFSISAFVLLIAVVFWQKNFKNEIPVFVSSAVKIDSYNSAIDLISSAVNSAEYNGIYQPLTSENSGDEVSKITYKLVESFEGDIDTSYIAPKNGEIGFSQPLRQAIEAHKNEDVLYRIYVDLFKNEQQLTHEEMREEMQRLIDNGYVVVEEKYFDGKDYHYSFSLHITNEKIETLSVNENYGMFLFFYDERK